MAKASSKTSKTAATKSTRSKSSASKNSAGSEAKLIRELAEILNETSLSEIEMEKGSLRVRVARNVTQVAAPAALAPIAASIPAAQTVAPVAADAALAPSADEPDMSNAVKSPMVGTAYIRPSPEANPFVKVGDSVKAGDTVLLVEAMKTFNPITAEKAGTITALLVDDGAPVEFGQPLFTLN